MDTLRFLLAIALTIVVVVVTNLLFAPPPPEEQPGPAPDTVEVAAPPDTAVEEEAPVALPEPAEPTIADEPGPAAQDTAPADTVVVESPLYRYAISSRGAGIVAAELLRFESFTRDGAVDLVAPDQGPLVRYGLRVGDRTIDLADAAFTIAAADDLRLEPGDEPARVRLVHRSADGYTLELTYTFHPGLYRVGIEGRVAGLPDQAMLLVGLGPTLAINEEDPAEDQRALAYAINNTREGISDVGLNDVEGERTEEGPLHWVALRNKYFLAAALRDEGAEGSYFGGAIAEDVPGEHNAQVTATLPIGRDQSFAYQLYLGPQDYERLAQLEAGLEDVNPYGWRILRPIIRPLAHLVTWALVELQRLLGVGYGWVLILFGVLIRMLLWPLNAKAMRSQLKNMELQPILKEIQAKYKNEPERLQKEMVKLYREKGFNPLGGCLPMLIPFPVLITLFFVFQNTIEFRGVEFLWLPDLSRPDPLFILPVLLGLSMFIIQFLSARSMTTQNPQMKMMMWIMPAVMVIIFFNLASGLNLYYAAQNLASVPQQIQIMKERRRVQGTLAAS